MAPWGSKLRAGIGAALALWWLWAGCAQVFAEAASPEGYPLPPPLTGPIKIGIQAGHWKTNELPDELARRRNSAGAQYGDVKEVDVNLAVAKLLVAALAKRGYQAELLPATLPVAYRADLFISLHADWGDSSARSGWKLTPPWRPNAHSRALAAALAAAFSASGLPEDKLGATNGMRGYFGFNYRRHQHALSPYTPAALVEMGYVTNAADRSLLKAKPELFAAIVEGGIVAFLDSYKRADSASYVPPVYPWLAAGPTGSPAYAAPNPKSEKLRQLAAGTVVFPVEKRGDWYEVFIRGLRRTAWIEARNFSETADPLWPLPGENPQ